MSDTNKDGRYPRIVKGIGFNTNGGGFQSIEIDGNRVSAFDLLTPSEVAAREAAAWAAGAAAMREMAAAKLEPYAESYAQMSRVEPGCRVGARSVEADLRYNMISGICDLSTKTSALYAMLAQARAEGAKAEREACAMAAHKAWVQGTRPEAAIRARGET